MVYHNKITLIHCYYCGETIPAFHLRKNPLHKLKSINSHLDTVASSRCTKESTDLFAAHGLEHLLQLDSELLNVVEEDAGLQESIDGGDT